jgi:5-methylcytosine-specific restriction endonuclease McrA
VASRIPTYKPPGALPAATPASRKADIAWYMSARWRALRIVILRRDPICRGCEREASSAVDHIQPRKVRPDLAWDETNLQGICRTCHNEKRKQERQQA